MQFKPSGFPVQNRRLGEVDDDFAEEVVGFEPIVVPDGEFHGFEGEFGTEDRSVNQSLVPFGIERFCYGFCATFVLRISGRKKVNLIGNLGVDFGQRYVSGEAFKHMPQRGEVLALE